MARQKLSSPKATSTTPATKKRKRVNTTDSAPPAKKARPPAREKTSPKKTASVKQETLECDICAESKPIYRNFPSLPTCSHDATVCSDCYEKHFITKINEDRKQGWSACTCPLCGEKVQTEDAQSILPRHVSRDLVTMIKNVEEHTDQDWVWCLGPDCGRGQLHTSRNKTPRVVCKYCKFATCSKHQVKWHESLTCDEFDEAGDHDASMVKSVEEIQRTTKPCPHCKTRIKKEGGCNHMTCTGCRKSWLWDAVAFDGEQVPSTAEVRGGSAGHQPLNGEERQVIEQVMQFENGDVGNPRPAPNTVNEPATNGFLHGFIQAIERVWRPQVNVLPGPAPPQQQPNPQLVGRVRNAPVAPRRRERQAQASAGDENNRGIRRTQTARLRLPRLPAGPGFDRPPRAIPIPQDVVIIELDSSDSSDDSDNDVDRSAQTNVGAGRRRPGIRPEVIDLTQDAVVVDLTGDD